ncbi:MAG TPA: hypothetical protein VGI83_05030 [Gemmatimonadales bacterium]
MFNRELVLFHLREARDELDTTIRDIEATPDYGYGEYWVAMQHLYHHANAAWSGRESTPAEAKDTDAHFATWSRFPNDLPMME